MQLEGKRIIVTGAAGGIGSAAVRCCAREGATITALDVNEAALHTLIDDAGLAGQVRALECDVANRASVDAAFAAATDYLGGLDALVHTAGIGGGLAAESITDEEWDRTLNVNAKGTLHTNQAAFRSMQEAGGSIINFGSIAGLRAMGAGGAYSASKGAVMAWTRVAAKEWGRFGIRVNSVAPTVATPMYTKYRASLSPEELAEWDAGLWRDHPLGGRMGDPELDLGPVLVFLASDSSRYMTGQVVSVDGGHAMLGS
jgi:NAD(P)-dependent dehydrogenase (short-subunit alcohol dehydrogenase family)